MNLRISMDTKPALRSLANLKRQAPKALAKSLNGGRNSARKVMVQAVAADMKLPQKQILSVLRTSNATPKRFVAEVAAPLRRLTLYRFKATQFKKGVKANTGRGRRLYPGTFIAFTPDGKKQVFARVGKSRYPIAVRRGVSIGHVFNKHVAAGLSQGVEQFHKDLRHEIQRALDWSARL